MFVFVWCWYPVPTFVFDQPVPSTPFAVSSIRTLSAVQAWRTTLTPPKPHPSSLRAWSRSLVKRSVSALLQAPVHVPAFCVLVLWYICSEPTSTSFTYTLSHSLSRECSPYWTHDTVHWAPHVLLPIWKVRSTDRTSLPHGPCMFVFVWCWYPVPTFVFDQPVPSTPFAVSSTTTNSSS